MYLSRVPSGFGEKATVPSQAPFPARSLDQHIKVLHQRVDRAWWMSALLAVAVTVRVVEEHLADQKRAARGQAAADKPQKAQAL